MAGEKIEFWDWSAVEKRHICASRKMQTLVQNRTALVLHNAMWPLM